VARELKKQGNKNVKKSKSDLAGLIRIIDIYELALKRYKGDIDLWFRFLEFCRVRKNGRMKKVTSFLYSLFIFIVLSLL
jgi:U3 small nucleolar RNA-associated protein 6